jgi:hypothetical protein
MYANIGRNVRALSQRFQPLCQKRTPNGVCRQKGDLLVYTSVRTALFIADTGLGKYTIVQLEGMG